MDAKRPELASKLLEVCLKGNDVDGLEGLYEAGAIFVDYEGSVEGWPDIRAAHQGFLDDGLSLALNDSVVFQTDDIALVHWSWTVTQPDGTTNDGISAEVLRRQADGTWKFVIDREDTALFERWPSGFMGFFWRVMTIVVAKPPPVAGDRSLTGCSHIPIVRRSMVRCSNWTNVSRNRTRP